MKPQVPEGAVVRVAHLRRIEGRSSALMMTRDQGRDLGLKVSGKGGMTLVQVEFADGTTKRGSARCSALDNYCKSKGRMIALGRALKQTTQQYPCTAEEALS